MNISYQQVFADSMTYQYDRSIATVLSKGITPLPQYSVSKNDIFQCYVAVKEIQYPYALTTVILFGLSAECTLDTCLAISNHKFIERGVTLNEQRIELFLADHTSFRNVISFFNENNFVYEISFHGDEDVEVVFLRKVVPVISRTHKILQMFGLR